MSKGSVLFLTVTGALLRSLPATAQSSEAPVAGDQPAAPTPPAQSAPKEPEPKPAQPQKPESSKTRGAPASKPTGGVQGGQPAPTPKATAPQLKEPAPIPPPSSQPAPSPAPSPTFPTGAGASGASAPANSPARSNPGPRYQFPQPGSDAERLRKQGNLRPTGAAQPGKPTRRTVGGIEAAYAEDWWTHARPAVELHGYFRTRAELFHNFSLGRIDPPSRSIWAAPADNQFVTSANTEVGPELCTADETSARAGGNDDPALLFECRNRTQSGANLRFRVNPELHISDNVRIISQIDLLDNLVLGSTPEGYRFSPSAGSDFEVVQRSGYNQVGFYDNTQLPPSDSSNSFTDSIVVKRAWAEYTTPVGELRFGRMPNHWGLGIVHNSGDGYDDDYQSTVDRIMVASGIKPLDLTIAAAWDFPNEGPSGAINLPGTQPYDLAQRDDVDQYALILLKRKDPQLTKLALSRGDLVLNAGAYILFRKQLLANDVNGTGAPGENVPNASLDDLATDGFARRGATQWLPDLWLQLLYKRFRFEVEAAAVLGKIESLTTRSNNAEDFNPISDPERKIRQFGLATELEQLFVEDRLHLDFRFGWSSGDADAFDDSVAGNLIPGPNEQQVADDTISTFRFHPGYRIDLILHRYILNRVQGTYYFNPGIRYDFMRDASGQRLGGGAQLIWSRASEFVQTPGHARDLGLELNGSLYFQSKDGALNDEPSTIGGFYTQLQYGVLFPLSGLGYQAGEQADLPANADTSAAQILRWYLGALF